MWIPISSRRGPAPLLVCSRGTAMSASRDTEMMKGNVMMARITPAVR